MYKWESMEKMRKAMTIYQVSILTLQVCDCCYKFIILAEQLTLKAGYKSAVNHKQ